MWGKKTKIGFVVFIVVSAIINLSFDFETEKFNEDKQEILDARGDNPEHAYQLSLSLYEKVQKSGTKEDKGYAAQLLGVCSKSVGKTEEAEAYYQEAITLFEENNDPYNQVEVLLNLATLYISEARFNEGGSVGIQALEIAEKNSLNDSKARSLNTIGLSFDYQDNFIEALGYYQQALAVYQEEKNQEGIGNSYNNIGVMYDLMNNTDSAIYYYSQSLRIDEKLGNDEGVAGSLINLALIEQQLENYDKADSLLSESLRIYEEKGTPEQIAIAYNNQADLYNLIGNSEKAIELIRKSIVVCKENGLLRQTIDNYEVLAMIFDNNGAHDSAYYYQKLHTKVKDSTNAAITSREIAEMREKYENDKKELEIINLNKENEQAQLQAENQQRKIANLWLIAGLLFVFGGGALWLFLLKRKNSQQLENLNDELVQKNTEIVDSINYAKRIQQALLLSEEHITTSFPPHFIYFQPKDIVSGDFYWTHKNEDYIYIAVADCTGHGVPGAFMSMLGISFLNDITSTGEYVSPAQILDELRMRVIKELNQTGKDDGSKDGMDISLIRLDRKTNQVEWAGANNPLYVVKEGELERYKSDRQPIGYTYKPEPFTNREIQLEPGENMLYLFSDGYADQFGGEKGKKFKYNQFIKLLKRVEKLPMDEQKLVLHQTILDWRGDFEQIDDICIIGVRVKST